MVVGWWWLWDDGHSNNFSDGMVERCNRTIEALLATTVRDDQRDWDLRLPFVMAAYRATEHDTTGASPNAMMLGRETCAPLSLLYPREDMDWQPDDAAYVDRLQYAMAQTHALARRKLGKLVARQRRNYDVRAEAQPLEVGDSVYYYLPVKKVGITPKLQSYWTGPWVVTREVGGPIY